MDAIQKLEIAREVLIEKLDDAENCSADSVAINHVLEEILV